MSKSISYYDWELALKKPAKVEKQVEVKKVKENSLGISTSTFKEYLEEWKKKNL